MTLRVGFIPYLNMAPFHLGFGPESVARDGVRFDFKSVSPRQLGQDVLHGALDAGALSLVDYFRLAEHLEPIGSFGIGANGPAQSVLVFSKAPLASLAGMCAVSDETSTSYRLLQVLLEARYQRGGVCYGRIPSLELFDGEAEAVLLIGDEALKARREGLRGFPIMTDLGEEWLAWQGSPFVFARWAACKSLDPAAKDALRSALEESLAKPRLGPPEVLAYWDGSSYRLTAGHERSIRLFSDLLERPVFSRIAEKVRRFERLAPEEGLFLATEADLMDLGQLAQGFQRRLHPQNMVTFVIDSNPNYTNVCVADCLFCAFYRRPGDKDAYTLSVEQVMEKIAQAQSQGATTVLLQGGLNPELPLDYYTSLIRETRRRFPSVTPHFFTASEVLMMSEVSRKSIGEVLAALQEAGQVFLPGGGAEVLTEYVRKRISPKKNPDDGWMRVHRQAHQLGMKSTATMMYGHVDRPQDWIEHFDRIRTLQDETGGFTAFIPWSFKPGHTVLEEKFPVGKGPSAYLRMLALSRVYLDNIPHIQASWFSEGKKIGQVALHFGADDFGGTLIDENVHKATGHINTTTLDSTVRMIQEAGFIPAQRTTLYEILRVFSGFPSNYMRPEFAGTR